MVSLVFVIGGGILYLMNQWGMTFPKILIIALCLYVFSNLLQEYVTSNVDTYWCKLLNRYLGGSISRSVCAPCFLLLGGIVNVTYHKITSLFSIMLIAISIPMFIFEIPFSSLVAASGFFILSAKIKLASNSILLSMRKMSILMFLSHMYMIKIACLFFRDLTGVWITASIFSALLGLLVIELSKHYKIFRYLY